MIIILFYLILSIGFVNACINDPTNITEVNLSYANNCYLNCTDLVKYSYICYSDVGISYSIWVWVSLIALICLSIWTSYCFYIIICSKNNKNIFKLIVFFNLMAINIRLIWFVFRINGNNPHDMIGDFTTNTILKNLPQSILISEFCAIIIVWKSIISSTIDLRVVSDSETNKNYLNIILFCFFVFSSTLILYLFGIYYPIMIHVSNSLAGLYILVLIIGSIRYSFQLTGIIKSLTSSDNGSDNRSVKNIKFINNLSCFLAMVIISVLIINLFSIFNTGILKLFCFLIPIYGSEIVFMYVVSYTVSYEYVQSYKFNKISPTKKKITTSVLIG